MRMICKLGSSSKLMNFISPKLDIDEKASDKLIESSISALKNEVDSFAILAESEMNYVQVLVTEHGFVVQFQNGSIDQHFEFDTYLSRPQTIKLLQTYFSKSANWQGDLPYSRINLGGFWYNLGRTIGRFCGGVVRGFKQAHNRT